MKYKTYSDMGSIKIYTPDVSLFFHNGYGDGKNTVTVTEKRKKHENKAFIGHFTVRTTAYLSEYDCGFDPIHTFTPGRWFVYLDGPGGFVIEYTDDCIEE